MKSALQFCKCSTIVYFHIELCTSFAKHVFVCGCAFHFTNAILSDEQIAYAISNTNYNQDIPNWIILNFFAVFNASHICT